MPWVSKRQLGEIQDYLKLAQGRYDQAHADRIEAKKEFDLKLSAATNRLEQRIKDLGLETQEMLKFAAANGITEIEMRGLKCKISPAANLDKAKLDKVADQVNGMALQLGFARKKGI